MMSISSSAVQANILNLQSRLIHLHILKAQISTATMASALAGSSIVARTRRRRSARSRLQQTPLRTVPRSVTEFAKFEEDLKMEKWDVVVLVLGMLKKYGLSLSYVEARKMTTCAEVIDFIESQVCQDHDRSCPSDELDGDQ